jgi:hypothetical protein
LAKRKKTDEELLAALALRGDATRLAAERARVLEVAASAVDRAPSRAVELVRAVLAARPTEACRSRAYDLLRRAAAQLAGATPVTQRRPARTAPTAIEAWLLLSDDAWHAGRPTTAEEAVDTAEAQARATGDRRALGLTQLARARQLAARSRYRESLGYVDAGLETVKERELDLEARLHMLRAAIRSHTLSPEAPRHARRAVLLATELDDAALLGTCLAQLGIALVERGIHGEGRDVLARALALAKGRRDADGECRAQLYLSMLELDSGRPLVAQQRIAGALAAAHRSRSRIATGFVLGSSGVVQLVRRHPVAAARDLAQAEVLLDEVGDRHARVTFLAFLGAAELLASRRAEAVARFDEARSMLREGDEALYPRALVDVLSCVLDPSAALDRVMAVERTPVFDGWADVRVACRIVRAALSTRADARPPELARDGLTVGPDAAWIALNGARPIEFASRPSLRRLVLRLVKARVRTPARFLTPLVLARAVWPDDARIAPRLLMGRLHVSLSALRRLGLRDALETSPKGYRLSPSIAVHDV